MIASSIVLDLWDHSPAKLCIKPACAQIFPGRSNDIESAGVDIPAAFNAGYEKSKPTGPEEAARQGVFTDDSQVASKDGFRSGPTGQTLHVNTGRAWLGGTADMDYVRASKTKIASESKSSAKGTTYTSPAAAVRSKRLLDLK